MTDAPADPRRAELVSRFLVLALGGLFLLGLLGFIVAVLDADDERAVLARPSLRGTSGSSTEGSGPHIVLAVAPPGTQAGNGSSARTDRLAAASHPGTPAEAGLSAAAPASTADAAAAADPSVIGPGMPVVPVVRFWSTQEGLARADIGRALETGRLHGFARIVVEDSVLEGLADALDVQVHPDRLTRPAPGPPAGARFAGRCRG